MINLIGFFIVIENTICKWVCLRLYDLILYVPVNNLNSVMSEQVFLGLTSTKQRIKCLAQGHNAVPQVKREPESGLKTNRIYSIKFC